MRGGATIVGGVALFAAAGAAGADPRPFTVGGELGAVAFVGSRYRDSLGAFGLGGPNVGLQLAARALWGVGDRALMGVRVGYLVASASSEDTVVDSFVLASSPDDLGFHLVDVGWTLRALAWKSVARPDRGLRVGFDLEAGGALLVTTWVRGTTTTLLPRLGASAVLLLGGRGPAYFAIRLGAQYVPSGGASGGNYWDPTFAGVTLGAEFGGGR